MSQEAAREYGRLVAERLGALLSAAPPAPGTGAGPLASQRIQVGWPAGETTGSRAAATAAEISRALRLRAASGGADR